MPFLDADRDGIDHMVFYPSFGLRAPTIESRRIANEFCELYNEWIADFVATLERPAAWDDVGRMLYLADYLEPGRPYDTDERPGLVQRMPGQRTEVLIEVAQRRITWVVRSAWPLPAETVAFWNALVSR